MAFCAECKHELIEGATFCSHCGAPVQKGASAERNTSNAPTHTNPTPASPAKTPEPPKPKRGMPRIWLFAISALATAAVACAIIALAVWPTLNSPSQTPGSIAATEQSTPTQENRESGSKAQETSEPKEEEPAVAKSDSSSQSTDQPKESAQDVEAARRAKIRENAVASGKQVFEGTLRILSGEEVSALDGTPLNANGPSVAEQWRNSTYAYLMFDQATTVNNVAFDTGTVSRDVDHICIGMDEGRRQNMGDWPNYDGQRVCVACTGFSQSDGVSLVTCPSTYEGSQAELLYAEGAGNDGGQTAKEATKDEQMVVAFENEDFIVKMPASWQDTYIVRPYEDGAFMCGSKSEVNNPSNWGSITMIVPWADGSGNCELVGTSSNGKRVYVRRGPNGFFDNGATIEVK